MGRISLPDHEKLDTLSPLKVRGTPGQRQVWQEVGAELRMTETAFARTSLLILLKAISQHEPQILARAVKRANRSLLEQGYPPVTVEGDPGRLRPSRARPAPVQPGRRGHLQRGAPLRPLQNSSTSSSGGNP